MTELLRHIIHARIADDKAFIPSQNSSPTRTLHHIEYNFLKRFKIIFVFSPIRIALLHL